MSIMGRFSFLSQVSCVMTTRLPTSLWDRSVYFSCASWLSIQFSGGGCKCHVTDVKCQMSMECGGGGQDDRVEMFTKGLHLKKPNNFCVEKHVM